MLLRCRSTLASRTLGDELRSPGMLLAIGVSVAAHAAVGVTLGLVSVGGAGRAEPPAPAEPGLSSVAIALRPTPPAANPEPLRPQPAEEAVKQPPRPVEPSPPEVPQPFDSQPAPREVASVAPAPASAPLVPPSPGPVRPATDQAQPVWSSPPTPPATSVTFAGLQSTGEEASSVVYVIDASGPMVTSMHLVAREVMRSASSLSVGQRFTVIAFADRAGVSDAASPGIESFSAQLVPSDRTQLVKLAHWLDGLVPTGRSNPMDGLRAALALRPGVAFLLCRSISRTVSNPWQLQTEQALDELERLNPADAKTGRRPTLIKTIQFIEPDPTGTLEAIAARHGGQGGSVQPAGGPKAAAGSPGAITPPSVSSDPKQGAHQQGAHRVIGPSDLGR